MKRKVLLAILSIFTIVALSTVVTSCGTQSKKDCGCPNRI